MYTIKFNKNKEEFAKDMKTRINNRIKLLDFYNNVFLPTLKNFDGKIFNARFINSFRDFAKWQNKIRIFVSLSTNNEIKISIQNYDTNYVDMETLYFKINTNVENRIIFANCENYDINKTWLFNFKNAIEEMEKAIKKYDVFCKKAQKMAKEIEEYNRLNVYLRNNVEQNSKPNIY